MFDRALQLAALAFRVLGWLLETVIFGGLLLARLPAIQRQVRAALSPVLECPEGHRVETYGRTQCRRCGAVRSGWLYGPCPGCKVRPTFIACPKCQAAVWNPIR